MSNNNQIKNVSTETENAILRKSAYGLPNRPSEAGMSATDIKKAFYQSLVDTESSLLSELRRIVDEANVIFSLIDEGASSHESNKNNPHSVTKAQVGLGNVNNTSDADKPISDATKVEMDKRVKYSDVQDNYSSTSIDKPASANRVRLLDDRVTTNKNNIDLTIKTISLNSSTGVLTFTRTNGTTFTIDLPLEFLVKSGTYNATTKEIWLELENDNLIKIPVADLVNEYFADGTTITMYVDANDGNKIKFKISDTYKQKIDQNTSKRHEHSNKALLDTYTQTESNLSDAVQKKHSHSNSAILNATTASFTTQKDAQITENKNDIEELRGLVTTGGTIIYENGVALQTFNLEEIVYAAFSELSQRAVKAESCTKGGEIDRRLKALGG